MTSSDWRSLFAGRVSADSCTLGIDYLAASAESTTVKVRDSLVTVHQDLRLGVGAVVWDCARFLVSVLTSDSFAIDWSGKTVLELGSGTGIVGIATAICNAKAVVLTDLPELVPTMDKNLAAAKLAIPALSSANICTRVLDWYKLTDDSLDEMLCGVDVLVMSDVLYDPVLIPPLLSTCLALTSFSTKPPSIVLGYRIRFPVREYSHLEEFETYFSVAVIGHDGPTPTHSLYFVLHLTRKR